MTFPTITFMKGIMFLEEQKNKIIENYSNTMYNNGEVNEKNIRTNKKKELNKCTDNDHKAFLV